MAEVDNSTLKRVDLDIAFDGNGKDKEVSKKTNSGEQTVDFDVNNFLLGLTEQNETATPEKTTEKVETVKDEPAKNAEETQETVEAVPEKTVEPTVEELSKELETLKKRYSDSSKEGKRVGELERQIADLEQKARVYDQIVSDPQLENMVINYWQKGKQPSVDLKEKLGLNEDFVFDPDDMFKTGTDTNKVYLESVRVMANDIVDQKLADLQKRTVEENRKSQINRMKDEFVSKYGQDELSRLESFMNGKQLTLEDFRKLMTYDERDKIIAKSAATQQSEQIKKNQEKTPTLATAKSTQVHKTDERALIDALKSLNGGGFSFGE